MADEKKIELSVERVGDKLIFALDPAAIAAGKNGSCCNCNSKSLALDDMARVAFEKPQAPTPGRPGPQT